MSDALPVLVADAGASAVIGANSPVTLRGIPVYRTGAYALRVGADESDGPLLAGRDGLPLVYHTRCEAIAAMWEYPYLRLKVVPAPEKKEGDRS